MSGNHQERGVVGEPTLTEVSDGVFAYVQPDGTWWINNAGALLGPHGVVSVDTCATEARTKAYREHLRRLTPLPVRTVVNTHHHGDHTHGNYQFREATIVAHELARRSQIDAGLWRDPPFWTPFDFGAVELEPPSLTFRDQITLWVGDLEARVLHVGQPAHTTNDSVVWLPERSVLFAGDLVFHGGTPFVLMGSVAGAIEVLEQVVLPLGARTVVPGHGEVCGPAEVESGLAYLRWVWELALQGQAEGVSPLELARGTDLGQWAELHDSERLVGNLHRAYADLSDLPRGASLDLALALGDMVALNGGKPLTCLA